MSILARDGFIGASFDTSKYRLGRLCPKQHEFENTGQTLRRPKGSYPCVQCDIDRSQATKQKRKQTQHSIPESFDSEECPKYDIEKFYLGVLCRRSHEWGTTGMSLRGSIKSVGECIECRNSKEADRRRSHKQVRSSQFDSDHYLGDLCPQGHAHESTGKSLRFVASGGCVDCSRKKSREFHQRWKEKLNEIELIDGRYYLGDLCVKGHEHGSTGRSMRLASTKGCVECLRIVEQNRLLPRRVYHKTLRQKLARENPEKARLNYRISSNRRRANLKKVCRIPYTATCLQARLALFGGECAYCCCELTEKVHWDHVIPIAKGGSDSIDNLVPACSDCNTSKNAKDPFQWYSDRVFFSKDRWAFIENLLAVKPKQSYFQPSLLDLL